MHYVMKLRRILKEHLPEYKQNQSSHRVYGPPISFLWGKLSVEFSPLHLVWTSIEHSGTTMVSCLVKLFPLWQKAYLLWLNRVSFRKSLWWCFGTNWTGSLRHWHMVVRQIWLEMFALIVTPWFETSLLCTQKGWECTMKLKRKEI